MGFLNPIFLLGILAATIPLLIHLWSRRQAKIVDFSSLMFLLVAHRQSVRRIQLKHLLILLLRMAIIILIALALARPLLRNQFSFAGARAKTSIVVILDNSFSMGYQGAQGQRFEKAKGMALEVVQSLRRGDSVALILMSDIPDAVFRKLTKDLDGAKEEIRRAQVSNRSTHVPPSLELAHNILETSNDPNKEIYLISDFGQNGWENWGRVPNRSGARIFLLPVSDEDGDNTSVEELHLSNQLIGTYLPVQLNVGVSNHSDSSSEETALTLFVDGQKRRSLNSRVAPHESITTTFTYNFESPGTHTGYLDLTADRLQIDNRRYFALHAYGQIRVLCVGNQTLYLTLALNPGIQATPSTESTILPTSCSVEEFDDFPLQDYDILIVADVPEFSQRAGQQLQSFIREGKSVIYFVSDKINAAKYNQFADWLPANLGATATWNPPLTVSKYDTEHPVFGIFKPEDFSGQYAPQFYRGVIITPAEDARVVAQLSDGTPFLVERSINSGVAMVFNASVAGLDASNLMVNPQFVPLLQQTVLYTKAIQSGHRRNLLVGQTYTANYRHSRATKASVGRIGDTDVSPETVSIDEDGTLTYSGTDAPGIYQVDVQGKDRLIRDFFAVNVEPAESDLRAIEIQEAMDRVDAQAEVTDPSEPLNLALNAYRMGKEIWGELLILALICMLIESVLSNYERTTPGGSSPVH